MPMSFVYQTFTKSVILPYLKCIQRKIHGHFTEWIGHPLPLDTTIINYWHFQWTCILHSYNVDVKDIKIPGSIPGGGINAEQTHEKWFYSASKAYMRSTKKVHVN